MIKRVGLVGGGRWARTIARELSKLLSTDATLVWITVHNRSSALQVASELPSHVEMSSDLPSAISNGLQAVVIANASERHASLIQACLEHRIPVLSEKPIAIDPMVAESLIDFSSQQNCPFGLHLEFYYASYLDHLAELAAQVNPTHVQFEWGDPWSEVRNGEVKRADIGIGILQEQLPHCWSILSKLFPNDRFQIEDAAYQSDTSVACALTSLQRRVDVAMSRRADKRIRKVTLDSGRVIHDFSIEPGTIVHGHDRVELDWAGNRTLASSLGRFLQLVAEPMAWEHWELDATKHKQMIREIFQWERVLRTQMRNLLNAAAAQPSLNAELFMNRLTVDLAAPRAVAEGWRPSIDNDHQMTEFVAMAKSKDWLRSD